MEQYLQEIIIKTDKGRHAIYILAQVANIGESPRDFLAQVISETPEFHTFANVTCLPSKYLHGEEALKAAFGWLKSYISKNGETVEEANNPCNCPFVTRELQQKIFSEGGLTFPVKVNGT